MSKHLIIIVIVVLLIGIAGTLSMILSLQKRGDDREHRQAEDLREMDRQAIETREKLMRHSTTLPAPPRPDGQTHGYEVVPIPTSRPNTGGDR